MVVDAVNRAELSASAERPAVRRVRDRQLVVRWSVHAHSRGEDPEEGLSPCPNFPGRKIVYVAYCINCVLKLKDGGGLDR